VVGGNLYVAEYYSIRKIVIATGVVTTLAGDGTIGYLDGTGTAAQFYRPFDIAADGSGNLYVADFGNHCIRKIEIASKKVTTYAGDGTAGDADGPSSAARFDRPHGIGVYGGKINVTDSNHRIRVITP
jgi:hypothetical protein